MYLIYSATLPSSKKSTPPSGFPDKERKYIGEAVRALPTRILTVGKTRSPGVQMLVDEYTEKLKCYLSVEVLQIRSNPKKAQDTAAQTREEDNSVMSTIGSDDWVVLLDERGKDIRSEDMAELIASAGNTGASRLSFCIGGPYGHGPRLRERADISIKLSSMSLHSLTGRYTADREVIEGSGHKPKYELTLRHSINQQWRKTATNETSAEFLISSVCNSLISVAILMKEALN